MVVLFFIAMVLTCLIVDYFVQKRQATMLNAVPAQLQNRQTAANYQIYKDYFIPEGLFLSKSHLWHELQSSGKLNVGIDKFLQQALGEIDHIDLPKPGQRIKKGDTILTLDKNGKKLQVKSHVDGEISALNQLFAEKPASPLKNVSEQWLFSITPADISENIKSLNVGKTARDWMKTEVKRYRDFLANAQAEFAPALQDGGLPTMAVLDKFPDDIWQKFQTEFLA